MAAKYQKEIAEFAEGAVPPDYNTAIQAYQIAADYYESENSPRYLFIFYQYQINGKFLIIYYKFCGSMFIKSRSIFCSISRLSKSNSSLSTSCFPISWK